MLLAKRRVDNASYRTPTEAQTKGMHHISKFIPQEFRQNNTDPGDFSEQKLCISPCNIYNKVGLNKVN
jgi:hypothetical protein